MAFLFGILKNEVKDDHIGWIKACENSKHKLNYDIIDITRDNWLEEILSKDFDCFLTRPPGKIAFFKQLYDERIYIINQVLGKRIYPSYEEILIYENKRMLAYWLKANNIPHPTTWIFYHKDDALQFGETCKMPIVAKTSIGASGSGVKIFGERKELIDYLDSAFSKKGVARRWGPNLRRRQKCKRIIKRLKNLPESYEYFKKKHVDATIDPQKGFVILQEYCKHAFEWRAVKIGESYFAHKKMPRAGEMTSGTSEISWDNPSEKLLDFMKMVCDKRGFLSMAIDIFEPKQGNFLVNELQCFFGSQNPHQMIINGNPGRYIHKSSKWNFEKGIFNTNNSYDLRLQDVISILDSKKKII